MLRQGESTPLQPYTRLNLDFCLPMTYALCTEKNGIIQVHVRRGAVAQGLSGMEYERNVDPEFFLPRDEPLKRLYEVDNRG